MEKNIEVATDKIYNIAFSIENQKLSKEEISSKIKSIIDDLVAEELAIQKSVLKKQVLEAVDLALEKKEIKEIKEVYGFKETPIYRVLERRGLVDLFFEECFAYSGHTRMMVKRNIMKYVSESDLDDKYATVFCDDIFTFVWKNSKHGHGFWVNVCSEIWKEEKA